MSFEIAILDADTLGADINFAVFEQLGTLTIYDKTTKDEVGTRTTDTEVVIVNKVRLNRENLKNAKKLSLYALPRRGMTI